MSATPGPWIVAEKTRAIRWTEDVRLIRDKHSMLICEIPVPDDLEREANARLIAAAPDLLAACEAAGRLLEALRMDNGVGNILGEQEKSVYRAIEDQLKAAIAKAKGE